MEEPLEVRIRGRPALVMMRTPGADEELVTGYLIGEGLAGAARDVGPARLAEPADCGPGGLESRGGDVLDLADPELTRDPHDTRSLYSSSACGACGKIDLSELGIDAAPIRSPIAASLDTIAELPSRLRAGQEIFAATGGLHAAGAFSQAGELLAVREDVGRHNAVDKLVGWAARAGALPASDKLLCVSGRLSYEIVQKAIVAGFPIVAAVSAPSSLAVDLAERYRVTLCGFVRSGRMNVYAHSSRLRDRGAPRE